MDIEKFNAHHKLYLTPKGFVGPESRDGRGTDSQNGIRFLAEKLVSMLVKGIHDSLEFARMRQLFIDCEMLDKDLKPNGLLMRAPDNSGGQQGPDDTLAALWADKILNTGFAKRFLAHGVDHPGTFWDEGYYDRNPQRRVFQKRGIARAYYLVARPFGPIKYVYNNENPGGMNDSSFIGRMRNIICCAHWVAGSHPTCIQEQLWVWGIKNSSNDKSQDGKMLGLFQILIGWDHGHNETIEHWQIMLREHYPHGVGEVLGRYFHPAHFDHPNSVYLIDYFGHRVALSKS